MMTLPPIGRQPAAQAATACINALRSICDAEIELGHSGPDNRAGSPFDRTRHTLEEEILTLIGEGAGGALRGKVNILHCRAPRLLEALPKGGNSASLDRTDLELMLSWMTPDQVRLSIAKGFVPARGMEVVIDRAPDTPEWNTLILRDLSCTGVFKDEKGDVLYLSRAMGVIKNRARLACVMRAQALHHPQAMNEALRRALAGVGGFVHSPLALFFAGARPPDGWKSVTQNKSFDAVGDLMTSHHGAITLASRYGGLEDVLMTIKVVQQTLLSSVSGQGWS